jgi:ribosomal protein L11 methyltransferase
MPWQQVTIRIEGDRARAAEELLGELGAVSVTLRDAGDEPVFQLDRDSTPLWQDIIATGLFSDETDTTAVADRIRTALQLTIPDAVTVEALEDQDWERAWMADFHPVRFGRRLWICPSWSEPPDPSAVNLLLDPGLAFGSGTHPTTAMCLEWLEARPLDDQYIIDYGCGSGILAIAALKLGAARVLGVDNDPQAVTATGNNRKANGIAPERLTVTLPGQHDTTPADIVIANILSGPLQELMPTLAALVRPGGQLVLSGVLSEQTETLLERYGVHFDMQPPRQQNEWICVAGHRRAD